jgi:hypothetical protein
MSNSQFIAVVGAVILLLIGILLFERYADCQEKGGSFVMVYGDGIVAPTPRFLECQIEQSPSHRPKAKP